jgi:hypothetical protein
VALVISISYVSFSHRTDLNAFSGTTAHACLLENRNCVSYDQDADQLALSQTRITTPDDFIDTVEEKEVLHHDDMEQKETTADTGVAPGNGLPQEP